MPLYFSLCTDKKVEPNPSFPDCVAPCRIYTTGFTYNSYLAVLHKISKHTLVLKTFLWVYLWDTLWVVCFHGNYVTMSLSPGTHRCRLYIRRCCCLLRVLLSFPHKHYNSSSACWSDLKLVMPSTFFLKIFISGPFHKGH